MQTKTASHIFWYFYIGVLLIIGLGRTVLSMTTNESFQVSTLYPALSAIIIGFGIYGFTTRRGYFQQLIWKVIFWLCTLISATLTALFIYLLSSYQENSQTVPYVGLSVLLLLPSQYALFNYVYSDETLWKNTV